MKGNVKKLSVWLLVMLMVFGSCITSVSGTANEKDKEVHDPVFPGLTSWKIETIENCSKDGITVTFSEPENGENEIRYVSWSTDATVQVKHVWVKASDEGILYDYTNESEDEGLFGPLNQQNNLPHGISHVVFYYENVEDEPVPDLTIDKSTESSTVEPGEEVIYTITVTNNTDDVTATEVTVYDTIPANMEFAAGNDAKWIQVGDSREYKYVIGTVEGTPAVISLKTVVSSQITEDMTITNTAKVNCEEDETLKDDSASINVSYTPPVDDDTPELAIKKTARSAEVKPGEEVTYTITVTNNTDDVTATEVTVYDTIPANMELAAGNDAKWIQVGDSREYKYVIGTVEGTPAVISLKTVVSSQITEDMTITNTAKVNCEEDETLKDDSASINVSYTPPVDDDTPELAIKKTARPAEVKPGEEVIYTITVTNNTDDVTATEVTVYDTIPANMEFAAGNDAKWIQVGDSREYKYVIGTVEGTPAVISLKTVVTSQITEDMTITNTAKVNCKEDETLKDDSASINVRYTPPVVPKLPTISKDDGGVRVYTGDTITYEIEVDPKDYSLNNGFLIESPDSNTEYIGGNEWAYVGIGEDGRKIYRYNLYASIPMFARGEYSPIPEIPEFKVKVKESTLSTVELVTNFVSLYYYSEGSEHVTTHEDTPVLHRNDDDDDDDNDDDKKDNPPTIGKPDLFITKTDNGAMVSPGALVEYVITVENKGNANAEGVKVYETLPVGAEFVTGSNQGWVLEDDKYVYSLGLLNVEDKKEVKFVLKVSDPLPVGIDKILNIVEVKDDGIETATTDNRASDDTPILMAKLLIEEPPVVVPSTPPAAPTPELPMEVTIISEPTPHGVPDLPFTGGVVVEFILMGLGLSLAAGGIVLKRK